MKKLISKNNEENKQYTFFKIYDTIILDKDLTALDKLVYTVMNNRLNLSIENNWINENNEYYIYYAQEEIAEILSCSKKSVINSFNKLRKHNYIKTEKQKNSALKIYFYELDNKTYDKAKVEENGEEVNQNTKKVVNICDKKSKKTHSEVCEKSSLPYENFTQGCEKSSHKKDRIINTNNNNTPSNHIYKERENISGDRYDVVLEELKSQVNYNGLLITHNDCKDNIDDCLSVCADMLTSPHTNISKQSKPLSVIKSVLKRLTYSHVVDIVERFGSISDKISNIQAYLKTMIYNTCMSFNLQMTNQVNYDIINLK